MRTIKKICWSLSALLFVACGNNYIEKDSGVAMAESNYSSASATDTTLQKFEKNDSLKKFIRTADLRFRVKNVTETTIAIERIVQKNGGYITLSSLSSNILYTETKPISRDSLLEITKFVVENTITMRVPNSKLDTTLLEIAKYIVFLDNRTLRAENVGLMIQANKMIQNRVKRLASRLNNGKKTGSSVNAANTLSYHEAEADQATISNAELFDKIDYSTITVQIYQRETPRYEMLPKEQDIREYEPNLFLKLWEAFLDGWLLLEKLVLQIIRNWPIILSITLIVILYKRWKKRKTN